MLVVIAYDLQCCRSIIMSHPIKLTMLIINVVLLLSLPQYHWAVTVALKSKPTYKVLVLMVDRSTHNRFDLVHIGPAIDIAQKVGLGQCHSHRFYD